MFSLLEVLTRATAPHSYCTMISCMREAEEKEPVYFDVTFFISWWYMCSSFCECREGSPMSHHQLTQRVFAVGKPPDDKICFFCRLKNAVLLPVVGAQKKPN